jgi:glucosamine-6-phosphate deaminase
MVKKKPLSETDIKIVYDLIQKVKPHQIYAAGDLSDPHGISFRERENSLSCRLY